MRLLLLEYDVYSRGRFFFAEPCPILLHIEKGLEFTGEGLEPMASGAVRGIRWTSLLPSRHFWTRDDCLTKKGRALYSNIDTLWRRGGLKDPFGRTREDTSPCPGCKCPIVARLWINTFFPSY
jgi:hypothetical protein